jgi:Rieske 2Fe-2S family protein
VFGRPFLDLGAYVDLSRLDAVDREVTLALSAVESEYTGGTLKHMGVVAPWAMSDGYRDGMEAVLAMSEGEYRDFVSLADDEVEPLAYEARAEGYGDETDRPFSRAQQRLLAYRHGVYFPWKVCYHLLANDRWEDKHSGEGKAFSDEARERLPTTVALIESLPFIEVGRAVLFGLEPNDHAPLHRDSEPGSSEGVPQCVMLCPRANKRFYLQNRSEDAPLIVGARAYWFNDMDYHGVLADPFFRYSIRVDGVFDPAFVRALSRVR